MSNDPYSMEELIKKYGIKNPKVNEEKNFKEVVPSSVDIKKHRVRVKLDYYDPIYLHEKSGLVMYEPIYLYWCDGSYYGIYINYKEVISIDGRETLRVFFLSYKKKEEEFTVYFNLPNDEKEYLIKVLENPTFQDLIYKKRVYLFHLLNGFHNKLALFETLKKESSSKNLTELYKIQQYFYGLPFRDRDVFNNIFTNISIDQLKVDIKNTVDSYSQKSINNKKSGSSWVVIGIIAFFVIAIIANANGDGGGSSGGTSNCYVTDSGRKCCTVCKSTSYGDVACSTSCN